MSKFAVKACTDTLAAELAEAGAHVSVIGPGTFKSEIRRKGALHAMGKAADETGGLTEEERARLEETIERNAALRAADPVAETALHALFADEPKRRCMVTPNQEKAEMTIKAAIVRRAARRGPALQLRARGAGDDARGRDEGNSRRGSRSACPQDESGARASAPRDRSSPILHGRRRSAIAPRH